MESTIAGAIGLGTYPVALIWADEAPQGAIHFKPGVWGCVMSAFAAVAARGRAGRYAMSVSISRRSAGLSFQSGAEALALTCSGETAPAMTEATVG